MIRIRCMGTLPWISLRSARNDASSGSVRDVTRITNGACRASPLQWRATWRAREEAAAGGWRAAVAVRHRRGRTGRVPGLPARHARAREVGPRAGEGRARHRAQGAGHGDLARLRHLARGDHGREPGALPRRPADGRRLRAALPAAPAAGRQGPGGPAGAREARAHAGDGREGRLQLRAAWRRHERQGRNPRRGGPDGGSAADRDEGAGRGERQRPDGRPHESAPAGRGGHRLPQPVRGRGWRGARLGRRHDRRGQRRWRALRAQDPRSAFAVEGEGHAVADPGRPRGRCRVGGPQARPPGRLPLCHGPRGERRPGQDAARGSGGRCGFLGHALRPGAFRRSGPSRDDARPGQRGRRPVPRREQPRAGAPRGRAAGARAREPGLRDLPRRVQADGQPLRHAGRQAHG